MRRFAAVVLLVVPLLMVAATPSHAWTGRGGWHGGWHGGWNGGWHGGWHGGWRGGVIIGAPWWGPFYPYPYWYPPPYYAYPPPVIQSPPVYVQQPPAAPVQASWYYCASAQAYYPKVEKCREAWIKVPPTPE